MPRCSSALEVLHQLESPSWCDNRRHNQQAYHADMGFLDDARDKLGAAVDSQGDKIGEGLDKVGDLIDEKTGGSHGDKIDLGVDKAKDALDGLDGKNDDIA